MPRFLVTTRRARRADPEVPTALAAVRAEPDVTVVNDADPHMVTIEASADAADRLRQKWGATHYVEEEIHRTLR